MKFDAKFRPEACVMARHQDRPHMEHVWLDVEKKRLAATNGHLMIFVPCDVEADDVSGFIPVAAIEYARGKPSKWGDRDDEVELRCRERIECAGAVFDRPAPERPFPPVEQAAANQRRGDPNTITFAVNARYLYELACALGCGDADDKINANALITVEGIDGDQALKALHVESLDEGFVADGRNATASLMPCRLAEKKSPSFALVPPEAKPCGACGHEHGGTEIGGICVGCPCPEGRATP